MTSAMYSSWRCADNSAGLSLRPCPRWGGFSQRVRRFPAHRGSNPDRLRRTRERSGRRRARLHLPPEGDRGRDPGFRSPDGLLAVRCHRPDHQRLSRAAPAAGRWPRGWAAYLESAAAAKSALVGVGSPNAALFEPPRRNRTVPHGVGRTTHPRWPRRWRSASSAVKNCCPAASAVAA